MNKIGIENKDMTMGEQTQIGVKLDKALKDEVDTILRGLGVKPTTAINGLYRYILQHRELPFTINTQVYKPSALLNNLSMDYSMMRRALSNVYQNLALGAPVSANEKAQLTNVIHEFTTNVRQFERILSAENAEHNINWKSAFNGARRAFYVLEAYLQHDGNGRYYLEEEGIIKLSLALKMLREAHAEG
ncbi:type II toxin-antitoxin system RelB/DinJ family antitoxin (plasmid) [Serratia marcescens]